MPVIRPTQSAPARKMGRPFASDAVMPAARTTEEKGTITRFASGEIQLIRLKLNARSGSSQSCTETDVRSMPVIANPAPPMVRQIHRSVCEGKRGRESSISSTRISQRVRNHRPRRCHGPGCRKRRSALPACINGSQRGFRYFCIAGIAVMAIAMTDRNESWNPVSNSQLGCATSRMSAAASRMFTASARRKIILAVKYSRNIQRQRVMLAWKPTTHV